MFLLSRGIVEGVYLPKGYMSIKPFDPECFVSGSYTFRLGAIATEAGPAKITDSVELKPGARVSVWSLEVFDMRGRTQGILGNTTQLIRLGGELVHSVCIDPHFQGCLELIIANNSVETIVLAPGAPIGKVSLYDVSESFGQDDLKQDELPESYRQRNAAAQQLLKQYETSPEYNMRRTEAQD